MNNIHNGAYRYSMKCDVLTPILSICHRLVHRMEQLYPLVRVSVSCPAISAGI